MFDFEKPIVYHKAKPVNKTVVLGFLPKDSLYMPNKEDIQNRLSKSERIVVRLKIKI